MKMAQAARRTAINLDLQIVDGNDRPHFFRYYAQIGSLLGADADPMTALPAWCNAIVAAGNPAKATRYKLYEAAVARLKGMSSMPPFARFSLRTLSGKVW